VGEMWRQVIHRVVECNLTTGAKRKFEKRGREVVNGIVKMGREGKVEERWRKVV
jgi:hypothetical protein